jgi:hypothetical protein
MKLTTTVTTRRTKFRYSVSTVIPVLFLQRKYRKSIYLRLEPIRATAKLKCIYGSLYKMNTFCLYLSFLRRVLCEKYNEREGQTDRRTFVY